LRTKALRRAGPSGPQRSPFECRFDRDGCGRIALTLNHGRNREGAAWAGEGLRKRRFLPWWSRVAHGRRSARRAESQSRRPERHATSGNDPSASRRAAARPNEVGARLSPGCIGPRCPTARPNLLGRLAASVNSSPTDAALSRHPRGRLTAPRRFASPALAAGSTM
jgi:hypothetical protein